jgi:hypothetical protein
MSFICELNTILEAIEWLVLVISRILELLTGLISSDWLLARRLVHAGVTTIPERLL